TRGSTIGEGKPMAGTSTDRTDVASPTDPPAPKTGTPQMRVTRGGFLRGAAVAGGGAPPPAGGSWAGGDPPPPPPGPTAPPPPPRPRAAHGQPTAPPPVQHLPGHAPGAAAREDSGPPAHGLPAQHARHGPPSRRRTGRGASSGGHGANGVARRPARRRAHAIQ